MDEKKDNWVLLRKKVLKKIKFPLTNDEIYLFVNSQRGAIENFLLRLKRFLDQNPDQIRENIQQSFMYTQEDIKERVAKSKLDQSLINFDKQNEKSRLIRNLNQTLDVLDLKLSKLELQDRIKDDRIKVLSKKLQENGIDF